MKYLEETFEINSTSSGITESDGQGATWHADIWDFKVALNSWIILRPGDLFACYLVGDDAAEMPAKTQIRVVRRDTTNTDAKPVLPTMLYQQVKEFQDKKKQMKLSLDNKEVIIGPDEHLVVMVNGVDVAGTDDLDASASYFKLKTTRRRRGLD